MSALKFQIGERVSLQRWDQTERHTNKLGECVVTAIEEARCESGWMITVDGGERGITKLDQNWLTKIGT